MTCAAYADAVESLVADPRLRSRLSAGAVQHAARFGWSVTAAEVLRAYESAIDERRDVSAVSGRSA